jgi:hypothetical protein
MRAPLVRADERETSAAVAPATDVLDDFGDMFPVSSAELDAIEAFLTAAVESVLGGGRAANRAGVPFQNGLQSELAISEDAWAV